ncbi:MAG TPA: sulfite exporter TauE/SafE family protein [Streptosporangiaceae bacterium]
MHIDGFMVLGSAIVGLLVGLTGAGGGALMTPMLILLFGITPSSAISSDLVAAVLMRPVGAAVHLRKGNVNLRMVGFMVVGSVPMAFLGAYLLKVLGAGGANDQTHVETALGAALLVGAGAMVLRYVLDRRAGHQRLATISDITVRPLPTILIGAVGGLIVGLTSVGSGSLMIVLLLFVYPLIGANQLVGTDLTQAVPLTAAAALGALTFGSVQFGVTASLVIGSVPAVLVGSYFSSRAPDRYIRPIITFVIFASGLKYVGVPTTALGIILVVVAVGGLSFWLIRSRPWRRDELATADAAAADAAPPQAAPRLNGGSAPGISEGTSIPAPAPVPVPPNGTTPRVTSDPGPGLD